MSTDDANRCCWRIVTYPWWSVIFWTFTRCLIHPSTMWQSFSSVSIEWHFCIPHPNCGNGDYTSQYCLSFPYKLLWTIMDTLWTVVITQHLSIVVGKHFTVTIIKLPNIISRILIIHPLPIYFCTSSCYVRAAICLEGRLSLLALSSVYSLTVEDGSWSTPMVPAQLSVPL